MEKIIILLKSWYEKESLNVLLTFFTTGLLIIISNKLKFVWIIPAKFLLKKIKGIHAKNSAWDSFFSYKLASSSHITQLLHVGILFLHVLLPFMLMLFIIGFAFTFHWHNQLSPFSITLLTFVGSLLFFIMGYNYYRLQSLCRFLRNLKWEENLWPEIQKKEYLELLVENQKLKELSKTKNNKPQ